MKKLIKFILKNNCHIEFQPVKRIYTDECFVIRVIIMKGNKWEHIFFDKDMFENIDYVISELELKIKESFTSIIPDRYLNPFVQKCQLP